MTEVVMAKETWYEIEYRHAGEESWTATDSFKTELTAIQYLAQQRRKVSDLLELIDYRIVKRTLTTTVL